MGDSAPGHGWDAQSTLWNPLTMDSQLMFFTGAARSPRVRSRKHNVCQVPGCEESLNDCKPYFRRHTVCQAHAVAPVVVVNGVEMRFCQQCAKFERLTAFDSANRSCRLRLMRRNMAKRSKTLMQPPMAATDPGQEQSPPGSECADPQAPSTPEEALGQLQLQLQFQLQGQVQGQLEQAAAAAAAAAAAGYGSVAVGRKGSPSDKSDGSGGSAGYDRDPYRDTDGGQDTGPDVSERNDGGGPRSAAAQVLHVSSRSGGGGGGGAGARGGGSEGSVPSKRGRTGRASSAGTGRGTEAATQADGASAPAGGGPGARRARVQKEAADLADSAHFASVLRLGSPGADGHPCSLSAPPPPSQLALALAPPGALLGAEVDGNGGGGSGADLGAALAGPLPNMLTEPPANPAQLEPLPVPPALTPDPQLAPAPGGAGRARRWPNERQLPRPAQQAQPQAQAQAAERELAPLPEGSIWCFGKGRALAGLLAGGGGGGGEAMPALPDGLPIERHQAAAAAAPPRLPATAQAGPVPGGGWGFDPVKPSPAVAPAAAAAARPEPAPGGAGGGGGGSRRPGVHAVPLAMQALARRPGLRHSERSTIESLLGLAQHPTALPQGLDSAALESQLQDILSEVLQEGGGDRWIPESGGGGGRSLGAAGGPTSAAQRGLRSGPARSARDQCGYSASGGGGGELGLGGMRHLGEPPDLFGSESEGSLGPAGGGVVVSARNLGWAACSRLDAEAGAARPQSGPAAAAAAAPPQLPPRQRDIQRLMQEVPRAPSSWSQPLSQQQGPLLGVPSYHHQLLPPLPLTLTGPSPLPPPPHQQLQHQQLTYTAVTVPAGAQQFAGSQPFSQRQQQYPPPPPRLLQPYSHSQQQQQQQHQRHRSYHEGSVEAWLNDLESPGRLSAPGYTALPHDASGTAAAAATRTTPAAALGLAPGLTPQSLDGVPWGQGQRLAAAGFGAGAGGAGGAQGAGPGGALAGGPFSARVVALPSGGASGGASTEYSWEEGMGCCWGDDPNVFAATGGGGGGGDTAAAAAMPAAAGSGARPMQVEGAWDDYAGKYDTVRLSFKLADCSPYGLDLETNRLVQELAVQGLGAAPVGMPASVRPGCVRIVTHATVPADDGDRGGVRRASVVSTLRRLAEVNETAVLLEAEDEVIAVGKEGELVPVAPCQGPSLSRTSLVALFPGAMGSLHVHGSGLGAPGVEFWARMQGVHYRGVHYSGGDSYALLQLPPLPGCGLLLLEAAAAAAPAPERPPAHGAAYAGSTAAAEGAGSGGRLEAAAAAAAAPGGMEAGRLSDWLALVVLPSERAAAEVNALQGRLPAASLRRFLVDLGSILDVPPLLAQPINGVAPVSTAGCGSGHSSGSKATWRSSSAEHALLPDAAVAAAYDSAAVTGGGAAGGGAGDGLCGGGGGGGCYGAASTLGSEGAATEAGVLDALTYFSGTTSTLASSMGLGGSSNSPSLAAGAGSILSTHLRGSCGGTTSQDTSPGPSSGSAAAIAGGGADAAAGTAAAGAAGAAAVAAGQLAARFSSRCLLRGFDPSELLANGDDETVVAQLLGPKAARVLLCRTVSVLTFLAQRGLVDTALVAVSSLLEIHSAYPDLLRSDLAPPPPAAGSLGLMHAAVRSRSLALLLALAQAGGALGEHVSLAAVGPGGTTPLHLVALLGQPYIVAGLHLAVPGVREQWYRLRDGSGATPAELWARTRGSSGPAEADGGGGGGYARWSAPAAPRMLESALALMAAPAVAATGGGSGGGEGPAAAARRSRRLATAPQLAESATAPGGGGGDRGQHSEPAGARFPAPEAVAAAQCDQEPKQPQQELPPAAHEAAGQPAPPTADEVRAEGTQSYAPPSADDVSDRGGGGGGGAVRERADVRAADLASATAMGSAATGAAATATAVAGDRGVPHSSGDGGGADGGADGGRGAEAEAEDEGPPRPPSPQRRRGCSAGADRGGDGGSGGASAIGRDTLSGANQGLTQSAPPLAPAPASAARGGNSATDSAAAAAGEQLPDGGAGAGAAALVAGVAAPPGAWRPWRWAVATAVLAALVVSGCPRCRPRLQPPRRAYRSLFP